MSDDDFKRILADRARYAGVNEIGEILGKFGHDDTLLALIRQGIYTHLNSEDSGDWTSPASTGYRVARGKLDAYENFIFERGPKGTFNAAAENAALSPQAANSNNTAVAQLQHQVREMELRLRKLEASTSARKFKV